MAKRRTFGEVFIRLVAVMISLLGSMSILRSRRCLVSATRKVDTPKGWLVEENHFMGAVAPCAKSIAASTAPALQPVRRMISRKRGRASKRHRRSKEGVLALLCREITSVGVVATKPNREGLFHMLSPCKGHEESL